jgi:Tfp pilus assembly protein PilF
MVYARRGDLSQAAANIEQALTVDPLYQDSRESFIVRESS